MNEKGYKSYDDLTEEEKSKVNSAEQLDELTSEDLELIDELINKKKIIKISLIEKIKFLSKSQFEKIAKYLNINFGQSIDFSINDDKVELQLNGKTIIKFDEKESKKLIENGMPGTKYVKVTGIIKKSKWKTEENKSIKDRIIIYIIAGCIILGATVLTLFKGCSLQNDNSYPDISQDDVSGEEIYEQTIDIDVLEKYYLEKLEDLPNILRMIEDQHLSFEEDRRLLDPNHQTDYMLIDKEVQSGANFYQKVENFKEKYKSVGSLTGEELEAYIEEANELIIEYYNFLGKAQSYAKEHLKSTEERIKQGLIKSVDLEAEAIITKGQIDYIDQLKKTIENMSDIDIQNFINMLNNREIVILSDGSIMHSDVIYENLECFLINYENSNGIGGK